MTRTPSGAEPPIAEQTYRNLRAAILRGEYAPGQRLTGAGLATTLGVSRTPVRQALIRLQSEGLVESADGRSAWVRPLTASDVEEAYDIAEGLEGVLVARLAVTATEAQLDAITTAVDEMEAAARAGDKHAWVQGDVAFHHLLAEIGASPLMASMLDRVDTVIGRIRFLALALNPTGAEQSALDHRAVTEALRGRDGERARDLHQRHWSRVRETNVGLLRDSFAPLGSISQLDRRSGSAQP